MLALRGVLRPHGHPAATAVALRSLRSPIPVSSKFVGARSFASGSSRNSSGNLGWWHPPVLLTLGIVTYAVYKEKQKNRVPPELKKEAELLHLIPKMVAKGEKMEQILKTLSAAYESSKDAPLPPAIKILRACLYGDVYERVGEDALALPLYNEATKFVKDVNPISLRCKLGVALLDNMGRVYHRTKQVDKAEKVLNKAIRAYEKFQGQRSLSEPSQAEAKTLEDLDKAMTNVFLHYAMLLVTMDRTDEVSLMRERALRLVRNSAELRNKENNIMDQYDDVLALFTMQEERRLSRQREAGGKDASM